MIHYLIIRGDLPFGVTLAQLSHAAAESMASWLKREAWSARELYDIYFPYTADMTVVVLSVADRLALRRLARKLLKKKVDFHLVKEPDAPWHGQEMAIGVWPGERDRLEPFFKKLNTFQYSDWTGNPEHYRFG